MLDQFPPTDTYQFRQQLSSSVSSYYQGRFQSVESSHAHLSTPRRLEILPCRRQIIYPTSHSHLTITPQPLDYPRVRPMDTSNQCSYSRSTHVFKEPVRHGLTPTPQSSAFPDPATNSGIDQSYRDKKRTSIALPFDTRLMRHSSSHAVVERFHNEGSQSPLRKYDCKFCGKLFNRPSSLKVFLPRLIVALQQADNQTRFTSIATRVTNVS